jgi:putative flippase GtrA
VNFAIALYRRFALLIHEVAKFGVIGALAFVVTWAGTNVLHFSLGMGPLTSNAIATVVAATFAYAGNKFWTFRNSRDSGLGREYFLFFVLNGIGLLIQLLCIGFVHYTLHMQGRVPYNVALIIGIILGTLFRYWSYKKWVFLPPQLPAVDARTGLPSRGPVTVPDSLKGTYTAWRKPATGSTSPTGGTRDARMNGHGAGSSSGGPAGNSADGSANRSADGPVTGAAGGAPWSDYARNRDSRSRRSWEVRARPGTDRDATGPLGGGDPPRSDD